MKRLTLMLAAAAVTAISVPTSARAQTGCRWWDLTCNGLASRVNDYGWHMTNRDQAGNVVYLRRRVDSNGNVIFEQARRNDFGRYLVLNNYTLRNGTVYGANGERCRYNQNERGYKEECKYAKGTTVSGVRYPSDRFATGTGDCKYSSNEKGYKEQCKYARVNVVKPSKAHVTRFEAPKPKAVKYTSPKVHTVKYSAPKVHTVKYNTPKSKDLGGVEVKEIKGKGPKH